MTGLIAPRARFSVAGDRSINDLRIDRFNAVVIQTHAVDNPWAETLYQHVCLGDEATHLFEIIRILQVGREALLIAVYSVK